MVVETMRKEGLSYKEMWLLYQECGSVCQVAKKMKRDRGTVSRHIMAYEASLRTANILTETHNY